MFDAYGPFSLEKKGHHKEGIDLLYLEGFRRDETENVENGIGVYIVASHDSEGKLVPHYVGRTVNGFGIRIKQHFENEKFIDLSDKAPLRFFLIARAINGVIVTKGEANARDHLEIEYLERELIAHCCKLNCDLLNVKRRVKPDPYVAGYRGDNPARRERAAKALGELLNT